MFGYTLHQLEASSCSYVAKAAVKLIGLLECDGHDACPVTRVVPSLSMGSLPGGYVEKIRGNHLK